MNRISKITAIFFLLALMLGACGAPAPATEPAAQPPAEQEVTEPVALDFVWSYGIETIQDNIKKFQELNPNITINLKDYSWLDYHDTMVAAFAANNAPHLLYGSDHWLYEWASAGWLAPSINIART
jgi:ABC-type glycerol-3-phosphate transport system substrate-binding protein